MSEGNGNGSRPYLVRDNGHSLVLFEDDYHLFDDALVRSEDRLRGQARNRLLRSDDVIDDVVQESMLKAWKGKLNYQGRSSFTTWLYSILERQIMNHYRRTKRDSPIIFTDEILPSQEPAVYDPSLIETAEAVDVVLSQINHRFGIAHTLVLHAYGAGMPYAQISEMLGMRPGTVRSRIHHVKKFLNEEERKKQLGIRS